MKNTENKQNTTKKEVRLTVVDETANIERARAEEKRRNEAPLGPNVGWSLLAR